MYHHIYVARDRSIASLYYRVLLLLFWLLHSLFVVVGFFGFLSAPLLGGGGRGGAVV